MPRAMSVSLDWLILGKGRKFVIDKASEEFTDEEMKRIEEISELQNRKSQEMIRALWRRWQRLNC